MWKLVVLIGICTVSVQGWFFDNDPRIDPHAEVTPECLQLAERGACEFYECVERRFPCGHRGFTVYVGQHFCRKVHAMMDEFTPRGRIWANGTSKCIADKLLPVYNSYASRCSDISDLSASAMIECNGRTDVDGMTFCGFVHDNSDAYQQIFQIGDIGRILRTRKPGLVASLISDGARCGAGAVLSRLESIAGSITEILGSLANGWNSLWN